MNALVRYEEMRVAVEQCARIDEASEIRDKAAALQAYARQRDDRDLDVWTSEIKLRASVRIGELVRELDTAQGRRNELLLGGEKKSKAEAILQAGLSVPTAHRYEQLAGPREEALQAVGKAAAETYFAKARAEREPATMDGLRGAVKDAVEGVAHNHRAQGTGENEWYTPPVHIEAARALLGRIDLDPASSELANETVRAEQFYTLENDGLTQPWRGKVWLNPPYAQPWIMQFMQKLVQEVQAGNVHEAIALTHNYTDTAWFHLAASCAAAVCFTKGRIGFLSPDGKRAAPTQGQAFIYYGSNIDAFAHHFGPFGLIVVRHGV